MEKLNKALYGLPEAVCVWQEDFENNLKSLSFTPLGSDAGVFVNKSARGIMTIDIHVDNVMGNGHMFEQGGVTTETSIQEFYKIKEKDTSKPFNW